MDIMKPSIESKGIVWPKLTRGTLIKRYKRFMADVELENGKIVTAHCPNSGSMQECCETGRPVFLSLHDNPKRKLKYTWELIEMPTSLVGVNTQIPNKLVTKAIKAGLIPDLYGYDKIVQEVKTSSNSRLDLFLSMGGKNFCFVEIKNCTLVKNGTALFPDAVTSRGLKHLIELRSLVTSETRCVMFYLIQRMDAKIFQPADHIDPVYGRELRQVVNHGVEIIVYDVHIDLEAITINRKIPHKL